MKSILKPCPFCGSLEIAVGSDEGTVTRHNTAFGDLTRTVPSARQAYCCTCGCSAPSVKVKNYKGWYDEKEQADALERAIAAWNRRAQPDNEPLTRCANCKSWDKSISFMSAHACAFWSGNRKNPRYTQEFDFCSFAEAKPERSEG